MPPGLEFDGRLYFGCLRKKTLLAVALQDSKGGRRGYYPSVSRGERAVASETRPAWVSVLLEKLEKTIEALDKAGVAEWIELFRRPRRLLVINFFSGLARGFGIAVGFTVVGAIFLVLLGRIAQLNLPIISEFVTDIVRLVQLELRGL